MDILEILNRVWYFLLFPIVALIIKEDKEVPILFTCGIIANYILFDIVGVIDQYWFLFQSLFDLLFVLISLLIPNKYIRYACILVCMNMFFINIFEYFSTYASIFYDWWEIINWIALDLIAVCLITEHKMRQKYVYKD